jgi:ATP synthase protein I
MSKNGSGAPPPAPRSEGSSFDERLKAARNRQGLDASASVRAPAAGGDLGVGLRVGVELVSALAVAVAIGWGLDHWLHTMPAFLCVFVLLGGAAGILNVWRVVARPQAGSAGDRKE